MKQKFSTSNSKDVLNCLEIVMKDCRENSLKWTRPPTPEAEVSHLSESMQSLELDDSLSQILVSIKQQLKSLDERVKSLEVDRKRWYRNYSNPMYDPI